MVSRTLIWHFQWSQPRADSLTMSILVLFYLLLSMVVLLAIGILVSSMRIMLISLNWMRFVLISRVYLTKIYTVCWCSYAIFTNDLASTSRKYLDSIWMVVINSKIASSLSDNSSKHSRILALSSKKRPPGRGINPIEESMRSWETSLIPSKMHSDKYRSLKSKNRYLCILRVKAQPRHLWAKRMKRAREEAFPHSKALQGWKQKCTIATHSCLLNFHRCVVFQE